MTKSFTRLMVLACLGSGLVPLVTVMLSRKYDGLPIGGAFFLTELCAALVVVFLTARFHRVLKKQHARLDANAREQDEFLEGCSPKYLGVAIVGAAALSLFLELAVIRWQSYHVRVLCLLQEHLVAQLFFGVGSGLCLGRPSPHPARHW